MPLHLFYHANSALDPADSCARLAHAALDLLAILVPPDTIRCGFPKLGGVLIALDAFPPFPTDLLAVDQDVDFLAVAPALGVLIPGSLDADVAVRDEQFDVAAAPVEFVAYRPILVFADVVADVKAFALGWTESGDELAGEHLVRSALAGHHLTSVVVAQTDVVGDFDSSLQGISEGIVELSGVEIGGLDKDRLGCIADAGKPGFVLWDNNITVGWCSERRPIDECDGKR